MNVIAKMNLNNAVERVLHVPGNYTGGILEMTLAIDCALPVEYVRQTAAEIAATLRTHSEVFRNVRLNLLYYKSEEEIENRVVPISFLQMSRCFEDYVRREEEKSLDRLAENLKLFHARSKLILVLAGEELKIRDKEVLQRNMQPFLGKKSLFLKVTHRECAVPGTEDSEMKWLRGAELMREWQ